MAHYTLIARINAGDGKFPYVNVQFSKNHRPVPIEGATYQAWPATARCTFVLATEVDARQSE